MFMSKLTEKVVASQLINHISSNGLDEILQSAYNQFHSTKTALGKVFNDIVLDVDMNGSNQRLGVRSPPVIIVVCC